MDFDALIATTIDGKYRIDGLIGTGGMGAVYRAYHLGFDKTVAIKVINTSSPNSAGDLQRFKREAAALERLSHPNIVKFFAFDIFEGRPYAVLEYLEGRGLDDMWAEGGLVSMSECVSIFSQILGAVAAAHERGIVHRDLKPSNVLVVNAPDTVAPQMKVLDFGLAKALEDTSAQKVTQTGALLGTPLYMSPEQCMGKPAGVQSDIYAIGCMLFECISGSPPFSGGSSYSLLVQHMSETPPQLTDRQGEPVAIAAEDIVLKALKKDPADRYKSADEFLEAIQNLAASAAGSASRRTRDSDSAETGKSRPKWQTGGNTVMAASTVAFTIAAGLFYFGNVDKLADPVTLSEQANALVDSQEYPRALELMKRAVPDNATIVEPRVLAALKQSSKTLMTRYTNKLMNVTAVRDSTNEPAELAGAAVWAASRYADLAPAAGGDVADQVMAYRFLAQSAAINPTEYKGVKIGGDNEGAQKYVLLCYNAAKNCDQSKLTRDFWSYLGNVALATSDQLYRQSEATLDSKARNSVLLKSRTYSEISLDCYERQKKHHPMSPGEFQAQSLENAAAIETCLHNLPGARELWMRAREAFVKAQRPDLLHTSMVRQSMLLASMNELTAARQVCAELKATQDQAKDPFQKFQILFLDGWLTDMAKDTTSAEELLAQACALADSGKMRGKGETEVRLRYSDVLTKRGKFTEARRQVALAQMAVPPNLQSKYRENIATALKRVEAGHNSPTQRH